MTMRATLLLEDGLYRQAKHLSKKWGTTLKEVINELLRRGLTTINTPAKKPKKFKIRVFKNIKPLPGFDPSDRKTWDFIYDRKL